MSKQAKSNDEIAKVLGSPVGFDISETASKLRRNLLLVSVVVIALIVGDVQPGSEVSVFGIKLTGLTSYKIMVGLWVLLAYNLIHYLWYCYELYSEWALRITGTRLAFVTGGKYGKLGADYPDDPRQSTLYTWWLQQSTSMVSYNELLYRVDNSIQNFSKHTDRLQALDMTTAGTVSTSIQGMRDTLEQARNCLASVEAVLTDARVPESLQRFDNRFKMLLKSQNLRLVLVEVAMPIGLALIAAFYLFRFFMAD
ncbi:hypothetical protein AHFPHNDE_01133 [Pseudomonas sp. MM227]|uniref:hypothetical protein n=1 Tax=Pseudomonas sp. MM227 TaxID=3019968 RepID=UPI00221FFEC3|nr:hypothetical protein [Pseudomonas sp. MM227]CAI3787469.1 hypothetical protein AHFPHNDE_01133 [Pseudomonas sp. MM227]